MTRAVFGFVLLFLTCTSAVSGDHRHVAGDALEGRECYILQAPRTIMWASRHIKVAGAFSIPAGHIVCLRDIDRSRGQLWYKVELKKMGTLDRSQHIPGWINSTELMVYGVMLSY